MTGLVLITMVSILKVFQLCFPSCISDLFQPSRVDLLQPSYGNFKPSSMGYYEGKSSNFFCHLYVQILVIMHA
jgi:hypothetical protein